jgi:hypothetical protein
MTTPEQHDHSPESWEQRRRSIAMLPTGAWALKREEALEMLSTLVVSLRRNAEPD